MTEQLIKIRALLDAASVLADELGQGDALASDPFTLLAQLIDSALAKVDSIIDEEPT